MLIFHINVFNLFTKYLKYLVLTGSNGGDSIVLLNKLTIVHNDFVFFFQPRKHSVMQKLYVYLILLIFFLFPKTILTQSFTPQNKVHFYHGNEILSGG